MGGAIFWVWLVVGGGAFIYLFAMLFEKAIFSNIFDDPVIGKGLSVFVGWLAVSVFFGFLSAGFAGFNPRGFGPFAIPAAIVAIWSIFQGVKLRGMQAELEAGLHRPEDEAIAQTFD